MSLGGEEANSSKVLPTNNSASHVASVSYLVPHLPSMKSTTAAKARESYNNGKIKDRDVFRLKYPPEHVPLVGYGAFVRDQMFTRQREFRNPEHKKELETSVLEELEKFLKTIQDPE